VRCREGDYHLCSGLVIFGLQEAGGLAENVLVPIGGLYPLPAELMSPVAALSEPMAVCVHAVRLAPVRVGDRVLVLGAGSIGLLSIVAARAAGAAEVWITARYPHQAEAARLLGATRVFGSGADDVSALAVAAAEEPPDVVLETVGGTAETLNTGVHAVRPGGTVVVLGLFMQRTALDALILMAKEVRVVGSMVYNRRDGKADFEIALDLLAARQHALHPLVTHDFDLEATQRAFDTAADKKTGAIKVIIRP
jgi:threonine dehydrogenase-like Zn-dependent dehydrogenase